MICFSHDHLGHGMSEGERATIPDVEWYVDDVIQHVLRVNFIISDIHISIPFEYNIFMEIYQGVNISMAIYFLVQMPVSQHTVFHFRSFNGRTDCFKVSS